jgi:hypothetical protein
VKFQTNCLGTLLRSTDLTDHSSNKVSCLADTIAIPQATFGYISPDTEKRLGINKIETAALVTCIGLVLIDKERKMVALAHIDSRTHYEDHLHKLLTKTGQYRFDQAVIAYSREAGEQTLKLVRTFAKNHANKVEEIKQETWSASIGADLNGSIYTPKGFRVELVPSDDTILFNFIE